MAQVIRERFEMGGLEGIFVCVVKSETRGKAAILRDRYDREKIKVPLETKGKHQLACFTNQQADTL